ncbi:hypothetical protein Cgig2_014643 [Carnegiea gigantea]|uniref:Fe2OG dioxygenase domain-containing protein n=1 Tax=Carnegiea gigantea TaxID=171969 RepID=A0A9Q1QUM6_9CARY|nr:hypothetical protein Cgig2_014643 [Carnegiea gigantea]
MEVCNHEVTITGQDGTPRTIRVPVVQELARHGTQDPPKMFTYSSSNVLNIGAISCPPEDFPWVSMARMQSKDPKERERELERLAEGAKEWGMLLVSDHGIPFALLEDVKEVVNGFFRLPFDEKKECVGTYASIDNMGYGRNFVASQDQVLDWVDRMSMVVAPRESTDGLNVWPLKPSNFRTSEIKMRTNYYPPCPNPNSTIGLSPHSDSSALTLLFQFHSSGGLQVLHKNNEDWVSVPWPVDGLLVVVGDLLEIMSNGRVKSPVHRAITQANAERCSIALFYNPPSSMEIEPVKSDDWEDAYKRVTVGDYIQHYYKVHPRTTKQAAIKFTML